MIVLDKDVFLKDFNDLKRIKNMSFKNSNNYPCFIIINKIIKHLLSENFGNIYVSITEPGNYLTIKVDMQPYNRCYFSETDNPIDVAYTLYSEFILKNNIGNFLNEL